ncbi:hypothetical protein [Sphingorhabdus sp. Alg231-15]|uniref:hypothetical protein n=1 Tax=Sphingorhabdus sp. Alg231-15 TaxID=1922222 RepID=UPI000D556427
MVRRNVRFRDEAVMALVSALGAKADVGIATSHSISGSVYSLIIKEKVGSSANLIKISIAHCNLVAGSGET